MSQLIRLFGGTLEYQYIPGDPDQPTIVFLHDGLGSVSTWGKFPWQLCERLGAPGLLYSRLGYGRSTALPSARQVDYIHKEALLWLPALLKALEIDRPYLYGHSDGASIALLYGSRHRAVGMTVVAPHVFVEPITITGVRALQATWQSCEFRVRLQRHHQDAEATFSAWSTIWLEPAFAKWDIRDELHRLLCPVLALQGALDGFGTMAQIHAITQVAPFCRAIELENFGHTPHKEDPALICELVCAHYRAACGEVTLARGPVSEQRTHCHTLGWHR